MTSFGRVPPNTRLKLAAPFLNSDGLRPDVRCCTISVCEHFSAPQLKRDSLGSPFSHAQVTDL